MRVDKKPNILMCESIYWLNTDDISKTNMYSPMQLEFQQTQSEDKILAHKITGKTWETVGANIFMLNSKNYLCFKDYHSKFPKVNFT